jgi:uncharacterized protein (TIGR02594 family)
MTTAREEDTIWDAPDVNVTSDKGRARVLEYFKSTDHPTDQVEAWCGAFAAHCLAKAGLENTIIKGAALAANWKFWGNTAIPLGAEKIPEGAIMVLAPAPGSDSSGHVGFYTRHLPGDGNLIEVLGGNQSDTVRLSKFSASKVVAIRWHDSAPPPPSTSVSGGSASKFAPLLDLVAQHESGGNYNAHYGRSANKNPDFTAMTIAQVLDWQRRFVKKGSPSSAVGRYQVIHATMLSLVTDLRLSGNELYDKTMQDTMAVQLLKRRKLDKFLAGMIGVVEFGKFIAQEWASMPVLNTTKGARGTVKRGQSYYAGDNLNKAGAKPNQIETALAKIK